MTCTVILDLILEYYSRIAIQFRLRAGKSRTYANGHYDIEDECGWKVVFILLRYFSCPILRSPR
jgi:hypothetical protein